MREETITLFRPVGIKELALIEARLIRKEFKELLAIHYWKPVFWSRSYCILTCGGAPLSVIKQYIKNQGIQNQ